MKFVKFFNKKLGERLAVVEGERVYDFSDLIGTDMIKLIKKRKLNNPGFLKELKLNFGKASKCPFSYNELEKSKRGDNKIMMPFLPPEVWAVGVTYKKTMTLHEEDVKSTSGIEGLYRYVYGSKRPEIFFKALAHHCVGTHEEFSIRSDSKGTIVEAELACIYDSGGNIVAYTAANDITAWDIEKECPLFLNQAKIFKGCCVLGPAVIPASELKNPLGLNVRCIVKRNGKTVVNAKGSTRRMKRSLGEMTRYLFLNNVLSDGAVLCTGTAVGIPNDMAIKDKDVVIIEIERVGRLENTAKKLSQKKSKI